MRPFYNPKILIIGPVPPPFNGVSVVTKTILQSHLKKKSHLIHLDTSDRRNLTYIGKLDFQNIYLSIKHISEFARLLVKNKPDIVYLPICQTIKGLLRDIFFILISKLRKAIVVIHLHGSSFRKLYDESSQLGKVVMKISCKSVSSAIVLSESLRYIFDGLVSSERIAVVSNGIQDPFPDNLRNSFPLQNGAFKILYLSSLAERKGYIDVIHAMPEVLEFDNSVKFIFAGEFRGSVHQKKLVTQFIEDNNLRSNLDFLGVVTEPEKTKLFLSSHIFVLPSHNEGQPIALIEAMAAGLPIITTNTGAVPDMILNGENGFIVDKENSKQISEKIILLLRNSELREKMGITNREWFLRFHTRETFIENLGQVFEHVLAE